MSARDWAARAAETTQDEMAQQHVDAAQQAAEDAETARLQREALERGEGQ
ncbi:hypothetical protein [Streptomyces albus]|nr:hypothetical protein [Streptomyces albus]